LGGEAQRGKLATELQRALRGNTLYVLDEPTTGLHPSDVEKLNAQLRKLVDSGNTVIVVEHDMSVVAASDWVIDIGPGAGDEGGRIVAAGPPEGLASAPGSRTAKYLADFLA
jgi:excinuclease ABC subunit A